MLPDLRRAGAIALDTETLDNGLAADIGSGWPWGGGYVCGVSVAYRINGEVYAHYFSLQHPDTENIDRDAMVRWLKDHIASGVHFITQNGGFDWGWLSTDLGVAMPPAEQLEEIGALATIVDENRYHYGLDALCQWRGIPGKDEAALLEGCAALGLIPKGRKKFNPQAHIWRLPARFVHRYAEQDAVSTLLLFESLDPVLDRENTREAYRLEVDLLPMVHAMRRRGIRIDISATEQARDLLLRKRDAALAQISERLGANIGMDEINGRKWLTNTCDRLGIEYPLTEKGNASFKRGKRGWMQHSPHWLPPLIAAADQLDQYGDYFLQQQILGHIKNGRVYGEIHPHRSDAGGTRSLRFSYSHPPLQQMPKHDEELAPLIRSAFLPEEGEVWASCDFNQQEFRQVVHFAVWHKLMGATATRDRYVSDPATDFHAYTSELTGGKISRQDGKTTNFMTIYGAGPEAIARQIKKPLSETKALLALYHEKMPFISQLATKCKNVAHRDGFFTLFNGARRHFNLWAPGGRWEEGAGPCALEEAQRRTRTPGHPWYGQQLWRAETWKALNALIQSNSAIQTKLWMRECWKEGVVPLLQMHDSLDLSVTSPEVPEMVARLGENIIKLEVPMVVDVKYGRTWADATHTWAELHAETSPRVEPAVELHGDRARAQHEDTKFHNNFDEALETAHAGETAENVTADGADDLPPAHEVDWSTALERDFPHIGETSTAAAVESPPRDDDDIRMRMTEEGIAQGPPPPPPSSSSSGASGGNGRAGSFDSLFTGKTDYGRSGSEHGPDREQASEQGDGKWSNYRNAESEKQAGKPYAPVRAALAERGYQVTRTFCFTVPGEMESRFYEDRFELQSGLAPSKERPHKTSRFWHRANGEERCDTGPRRIIFNWPAIMAAGPGSEVDITEGANKSATLNERGLLATAAPYHQWGPECVSALAGCHLIYHEDHDLPDSSGRVKAKEFSADACKRLAPVAASFRVVPALHLWKNLGRDGEPPHGWDVKDWLEAGGNPARLREICREIPPIDSAALFDPWAEFEAPAFPVEVLPPTVRDFVRTQSAVIGVDVSAMAMAALAALSGAINHRFALKLMHHGSWWAHPRLWVLLVGAPSTMKTPAINAATKALERYQKQRMQEHRAAVREHKANGGKPAEAPPPPVRYVASDTTVEALGDILSRSPRGLLVKYDEVAGWIGSMERYHTGRFSSDRAFWLTAYNGGPYITDRIKRGEIFIENNSVSLLSGTQPNRLAEMQGLTSDGLLQRLLPVLMKPGESPQDAPANDDAFDALVRLLIETAPEPAYLHMTDDALARMKRLCDHLLEYARVCDVLANGLQAFVIKLREVAGSLALILHLTGEPSSDPMAPVGDATVAAAERIVRDFILPHAVEFYGIGGGWQERLQRLASFVLTCGKARIVASDLTTNVWDMRGLTLKEVNDRMSPLEAGGWVEPESNVSFSNKAWRVSPAVAVKFAVKCKAETERKAIHSAMITKSAEERRVKGEDDA